MKRRLISMVLSLLILSASVLFVQAISGRVNDEAGLMTYDEIAELEDLTERVSSSTGLDLVILTADHLGGYPPSVYADDYYDRNGHSDDGILFMLAMQERDWYISTTGEAHRLLDDGDIDALLDAALPYFSDGYYFEGFREVLLEMESIWNDHPGQGDTAFVSSVRRSSAASGSGRPLLISILIGTAVSGIITLIMRGAMNTKRKQRSAADYLTPGSYHLRTRQDIFLYSNVTKTPRQQSSSSGGTSHMSSSGRSHGGGGRKF